MKNVRIIFPKNKIEMRYYTEYTIEFKLPNERTKDELYKSRIIKDLSGMDLFNNVTCINRPLVVFDWRWENWEEKLSCLSKLYPGLLISVDGLGDDRDDIWRAYFIDGKEQFWRANIQLPEFNAKPDKKNPLYKFHNTYKQLRSHNYLEVKKA